MPLPEKSEAMPNKDGPAVRFRGAREDVADPLHSPWVYAKFAVVNPWQSAVLAAATLLGIATASLSVALLVVCGAELLLLASSRLRAFRRYVDASFEQAERSKAAEQRATLLWRMGDAHRHELLRLESIVDHLRATNGDRPTLPVVVDECPRLLATYVRLAISHNVGSQVLASTDRQALEEGARALEVTRSSSDHQARALADRRASIARRRSDRWDRTRDALDAIAQQLAMLAELVQLTHEEVLAPVDPRDATFETDRILAQLDESQARVDEEVEFRIVEVVEPRMLDLGRMPTARNPSDGIPREEQETMLDGPATCSSTKAGGP